MADTKKLALIIDPDPIHLEIMEIMLEEELEVLLATSGSEALELIEYKHPNIILMERILPDMDGYALCARLKAKLNSTPCSIIILTEEDDIYDRMEGYQHGCSEFLSKPFQVEELFTKILLCIEIQSIHSNLKAQSDESTKVALSAMKMGSELGAILGFVEESGDCTDYDSLGNLVISTVEGFNISCSLLFKTFLGPKIIGCPADSPEEHVLVMCSDKERFVMMGEKMIVNHSSVSLLAINMPINDTTRYGELKDTLGIVINAVETRIKGLDTELKLAHERKGGLNSAIKVCHEKITQINQEMSDHSDEISSITQEIKLDVRDACFSLDLNEDQEKNLLGKIDNSIDRLEQSCDRLVYVDNHLSEVTNSISQLIEKN